MSNVVDIKPKLASITLSDGVERKLNLTLNAMAELEDMYGSVDAAFAALDKRSTKALRAVLWACLIHEDPELKLTTVGNLIDARNMNALVESLTRALENGMPAAEEAAATGANPN